ncbi:MAG: NAD(P)-binding protein [Nocardioidaceae bacterium]
MTRHQETVGATRCRIAVVGSGVAGLTAAHVAAKSAHVTLYEADQRPHSRLGGDLVEAAALFVGGYLPGAGPGRIGGGTGRRATSRAGSPRALRRLLWHPGELGVARRSSPASWRCSATSAKRLPTCSRWRATGGRSVDHLREHSRRGCGRYGLSGPRDVPCQLLPRRPPSAAAQLTRLDLVCREPGLHDDCTLLDIGGWACSRFTRPRRWGPALSGDHR